MEIPYLLNDLALDISPSIGICIYPEHGTNPDLLMQRADMAMSAAKGANLGVATFKPEYDRYSPRRLAMMGELRKAIRDNDLTLFYQPKIEIASGRAVAVEALVRWTHPGFGKIPPNEFIPMAERTGMIKPLTQWVINQALGQCASWLNKGITLDMAINLSAWDLGDIRLPERIGQMLEAWGLESRCLVLEITETAVMADPELSSTILGQLDEMGVRISVDDYGTGYSSLAYIKRLPLEELKIDQSFVHDMASAEYDATIVRSTVALAHNLGLSVVAEGVEDLETLQLLESLGCDKVQGYYLSRPLPANDLEEWYRECHAEPAGE
jgi:EAL domain-containing protein (putative c-di-GMP-specific phosphodiesterase class I)